MKPFNSNINFKFPIFQSPTQYTIPAISGENSGYHGNSVIIIRTRYLVKSSFSILDQNTSINFQSMWKLEKMPVQQQLWIFPLGLQQ